MKDSSKTKDSSNEEYLIEVTSDAIRSDDDYINQMYIGTEDAINDAKSAIKYIQQFHQKYCETHPDETNVKQSDVMIDLASVYPCNESIANKDFSNTEWINYINRHIDELNTMMD